VLYSDVVALLSAHPSTGKEDGEHPDTRRLDWLDAKRTHYSQPPFRAVTGWEWSVVDEQGNTTLRSAIDAAQSAPNEGRKSQ
jgi:hypothetical protein